MYSKGLTRQHHILHHHTSVLPPHLSSSLISSCSVPSLKFCPANFFPDLIQASQDQTNVNVPQMVDTLMERVGNASWVVVFKALITTHHLMVHGHEVSTKPVHLVPGWT